MRVIEEIIGFQIYFFLKNLLYTNKHFESIGHGLHLIYRFDYFWDINETLGIESIKIN